MSHPSSGAPPGEDFSAPWSQGEHRTDSPATLDLFELVKEVGWRTQMQDGQLAATVPPTFESVEPEIERRWRALPSANRQLPWDQAREAAKDAWDRVLDAVTGGGASKPSAK